MATTGFGVTMKSTVAMVTEQITTGGTAVVMVTTDTMVTRGAVATTGHPEEQEPQEFVDVLSRWLVIVVMPVITLVGILGNTLSIVTVQRSSMNSSSVAILITALAVVDSLVLIMDFLNNWVEGIFKLDILALSDAGCKAYRFCFNVSFTCSAWYVVTMALERFIVVWFPFRARTLCTRKTTIIVTCVIPVIVALVYAYLLFMWTLDEDGKCSFHPYHIFMMSNVHSWIVNVMYSYAPILIVSFCTISVALQLSRMKKRRTEMTSRANAPDSDAEMKMTLIIITTCTLFIVLTVPMTIFYAILFSRGGHIYQGPVMALIEAIILILVLSNHAINFFLYVLSSKVFRKELQSLFGKKSTNGGSVNGPHGSSSGGNDSSVTKVSSVSATESQSNINKPF